jgi:O-antigen/teichoic acid export membrane protein
MPQVARRSIRANFSFTLAGSLVYSACQWLMISLVTKSGNEEHLNNLVIALAISAPVIVFFNLQLRLIQALDVRQSYLFGDFLTLRLAAQLASLVTLTAWAILSDFDQAAFATLLLVGANRAVYSIGETFYGAQQRAERMGGIASSMALKGVFSIAFFGYFLHRTNSLTLALLAWGGAHLLLLLFDAERTVSLGVEPRSLRPSGNVTSIKALAKEGLPLGLSGVLIAIQINIPTYSMMASDYEGEVGIFGAILLLATVGRKVIEAAIRATGPRLANILGEGRCIRFRQLRIRLVLTAGSVGVLGYIIAQLFGEAILGLVYTKEFVPYLPVLLLIISGEVANFASLALEHALLAGRAFRAQMFSIGGSVITIATASLILIPELGAIGAGWTVLLGGLMRLLISVILTLKFDSKHVHCYPLGK